MAKHTVIVSLLAEVKDFTKGFEDAAKTSKSFGAKLGTIGKLGAGAAVGIGTAIAGLAAKGGFARAMKLEDATKKLTALGVSASRVKQISADALKAVKGTAYGLDEASTAAASAFAAGIKPGKDMTRYLTLVADSAQIAGVGMGEMGAIFGKVATNGRVSAEEMNQIADRGIPIYKKLADHYGVTADELRKMVAAGKVDLAGFLAAMEDTVGGAGKVMADTTRGQFANFMAAINRLGEVAVSPVFPAVKKALFEMTVAVDNVTAAIAPAVQRLAEWLGPRLEAVLDGLGEKLTGGLKDKLGAAAETAEAGMAKLSEGLSRIRTSEIGQKITGALSTLPAQIGPALAPIAQGLGSFLSSVMQTAGPALSQLGDMLTSTLGPALSQAAPLIGQLVTSLSPMSIIFQTLAPLGAQIGQVLGQIALAVGQLLMSALQAILPVLPQLAEAFTNIAGLLAGALSNALAQLLPVLAQLIGQVVSALVPVLPQLTPLLTGIVDAFTALIGAVAPLLPMLITFVVQVIQALLPTLPSIAQLLGTVAQVVGTLLRALSPLLPAIGQLVMTVLSALMPILPTLVNALGLVAQIVADVLNAALSALLPIVTPIISVISTLAQILASVLAGAVSTAAGLISGVLNGALAIGRSMWSAFSSTVLGVIGGIARGIASFVAGITGKLSAGWSRITAGVQGAMSRFTGTISNGISRAVGWIAGLPGRAVSAVGNLGSALTWAGRSLIQGFIDGIMSVFHRVRSTLSRLTNLLPSWKGPASKDARLLRDNGRLIIGGFIDGLEDRYSAVRASLSGLTSGLKVPGIGEAGLLPAGGGLTVNNYSINLEVKALDATPETGRRIRDALDQWTRVNGGR